MKRSLTIEYEMYPSAEELPEPLKVLYNDALKATGKAYAPYSNFRVGAAVLMSDGRIISGSNQENASYPNGLCAERVAVYAASTMLNDAKLNAIAVAAMKGSRQMPAFPCGACRQSLLEYEMNGGPVKIIVRDMDDSFLVFSSVADLLPFSFTGKGL